MRERFRVRLFFIMIGFATIIAFATAIVDHNRITEYSQEEYEVQMKKIEGTVVDSLTNLEKVYYYFDQETASDMERNSHYLLDLYDENPEFETWSFTDLKDELGMDIYIINEENVITHSSFEADIGMDFAECCSKLVPVLDERRASGVFYHDGVDIEQHTGIVKKFSYMATRDHQYLIQLGFSLQDGDIFQEFNILGLLDELENDYSMINEINILNIGGSALGHSTDEWKLPSERRAAFEKALETDEVTELAGEGETVVYRYVPYQSDYDVGATQNKVIEIAYNDDDLKAFQRSNLETFVFQLLIILVVTIILSLLLSKWMSKPIHMAFHDSLTGLKNRKAFEENLDNYLKNNEGSLGVFMVDLDNFKLVNDRLGHDQGDVLLKKVATAMKEFIAADGEVYRMGGDEFSIILPETNREKAEEISEALIQLLQRKLGRTEDWKDLQVTASIGVSLAPEHGNSEKVLYKKADTALYLSKKEGKNCYHLFEGELEES